MVTKMQTSTVWIQLSKFKEEPCNLSQGPSVLRWSDSNFHLIDQQYKNIKAKLSLVAMMAISCQEGHFKDQNMNLKLKYEGNLPWGVSILRTWKFKIASMAIRKQFVSLTYRVYQSRPHYILVFFLAKRAIFKTKIATNWTSK